MMPRRRGSGAANVNGMMIDAATTRIYQGVIDRAKQCGIDVDEKVGR